jgi:hypothetical protein
MAFRANPKGGPIRHPARVSPEIGRQNIRMVYDPTVGDEVEDLDKPKRPGGDK